MRAQGFRLGRTVKAHDVAVAGLALHPSKPILVTASDDKSWKMWHLPNGDLIMHGEGHKVSGSCEWNPGAGGFSGSFPFGLGCPSRGCTAPCCARLTLRLPVPWQEWVSCAEFHPRGTHLASGSGDTTVKVWDFEKQRCMLTLTLHSQAVWDVAWHDTGNFLASASLDHVSRLWDVTTGERRLDPKQAGSPASGAGAVALSSLRASSHAGPAHG